MAATITDLTIVKNYDDGEFWDKAKADAWTASVEAHSNTKLVNNLEQIAADMFPADISYTFDDDSVANLTNSVWDKQTGVNTYNGGDISIGTSTDSAYVAVDGTNAIISFTPELTGKYRIVCTFTHRCTSSVTTEFSCDVQFRLTDGTNNSPPVNSGGVMAATAAGSGVFINPICLTFMIDFTASAKTITLQKFVRTASNVNANVVNAAAATGEIHFHAEKV